MAALLFAAACTAALPMWEGDCKAVSLVQKGLCAEGKHAYPQLECAHMLCKVAPLGTTFRVSDDAEMPYVVATPDGCEMLPQAYETHSVCMSHNEGEGIFVGMGKDEDKQGEGSDDIDIDALLAGLDKEEGSTDGMVDEESAEGEGEGEGSEDIFKILDKYVGTTEGSEGSEGSAVGLGHDVTGKIMDGQWHGGCAALSLVPAGTCEEGRRVYPSMECADMLCMMSPPGTTFRVAGDSEMPYAVATPNGCETLPQTYVTHSICLGSSAIIDQGSFSGSQGSFSGSQGSGSHGSQGSFSGSQGSGSDSSAYGSVIDTVKGHVKDLVSRGESGAGSTHVEKNGKSSWGFWAVGFGGGIAAVAVAALSLHAMKRQTPTAEPADTEMEALFV